MNISTIIKTRGGSLVVEVDLILFLQGSTETSLAAIMCFLLQSSRKMQEIFNVIVKKMTVPPLL